MQNIYYSIMWSIVAFKDDSLEVVPSNWFNNELCAWPKKYLRSCIDNECSQTRKNNYKISEEKANRAKLTPDLSTNESSQENDDKNKPKLKRKLSLDKRTKDIANFWSPDSCDVYDDSDTDPLYSPALNTIQ
ncbi:DUF4806 domain-containing protein, partial [Aphis craccivora]